MEEIVKTSWRMPKSLLRRIKQHALDNDTNTTTIMIEAAEQYLSKEKKRA